MILEFLAAAVCVFVVGLILYARWNYGTLESMGITVVKPLHLFLGNTANCHLEVAHFEDIKRFKKYGPIYGVYEGRTPQVHVCDTKWMKCMMVTDFEYFKSRPPIDFGSPFLNEMPDFLSPHKKWKAVRQLLTPTFTSAKLKMMSVSMQECLDDYVKSLKQDIKKSKSKTLEKYDLSLGIYTMITDMIARSVFSINIENKTDKNNYFVQTLKRLHEGDGVENVPLIQTLSYSFPFLSRFNRALMDTKAAEDMRRIIKKMVESRKKSGQKMKDFLQNIVEWMDKLDTPEFKENNITEDTLLLQALLFFFAGQDNVCGALVKAIVSISQNKEIEKKVYEEMEKHLEKHDQQLHYENLHELTYLNACISEANRLVPFFTKAFRICTKDWEKDGIRIKKGTHIYFPLWAINRNPEYFPDPEKFDPERFMPENKAKLHPYAFAAFGFGPLNCIGMKLAIEQLLFSAAYLYKNFRFIYRTDSKMEYAPGHLLIAFCLPHYIDVVEK